mgnify:CR=1 FL=1
MAETLLSPGVLTRENDQSLVTQGPVVAGLAVLGPTVKGPVNVPTVVTSYSDYVNKFGGSFTSASIKFEYLTNISINNYFQQGGETAIVTRIVSGGFAPASAEVRAIMHADSASFTLETLSEGAIMNNSGSVSTSGSLVSGSTENIRYEIANVDSGSGTFNLLIRRGDDTTSRKTILESFTDLSLDPNSPNYIEQVIGNQTRNFDTDGDGNRYIQVTGSYANNSRFVRVSSVGQPTLDYLDSDGNFKAALTSSLPQVGSGSNQGAFTGGAGSVFGRGANGNTRLKMYNEIDVSSIQGLEAAYYTASLNLLQNTDEYDFEILTIPGVTIQNGSVATNAAIDCVTERGDAIAVIDTRDYETNRFLVFATRKGQIKKTKFTEYDKSRSKGLIAINLKEGDELVRVIPTTGEDDICLVSSNGKVMRFHEKEARPMGRSAGGVRGIKLKAEDEVVAVSIAREAKTLLIVTDKGFGKRTEMENFNPKHRAGQGVVGIKLSEDRGKVVASRAVGDDDEVFMISSNGVIIRMQVSSISVQGRSATGVKLMAVEDGVQVTAIAPVIQEGELEETSLDS